MRASERILESAMEVIKDIIVLCLVALPFLISLFGMTCSEDTARKMRDAWLLSGLDDD